jgi:hypothetical protein
MCNYITKLHLYDDSGAKAYPALVFHPLFSVVWVFLGISGYSVGIRWYEWVSMGISLYLVVFFGRRVPNRCFRAYPALVPHPLHSLKTLGTLLGQIRYKSGTVLGQF